MKTIGLLAFGNPNDKTIWSGTLNSEYEQLKKYYNVVPLTVKYNTFLLFVVVNIQRVIYVLTKKTFMPMYSSLLLNKLAMYKINKQIKNNKIDLVFGVAASAVQPFLIKGMKNIHMSDATFALMQDYYFFNMNNANKKKGAFLENKTLTNADALIYPSDWAMNSAKNDYSISTDKIFIIPFGANVDSQNINFTREVDKEIHILFIGVDWKRKGGDLAIKTVYELNKIQNEHKFVLDVVGGKPSYEVNKDEVILHGFLNKNKVDEAELLKKIINNAYINILPTIAECSGIAFIEAAMYGLPSITFNVGGIPTNVKDQKTGYCLPLSATEKEFSEKIMYLVNNPSVYLNMSKAAIELTQNELNWNHWGIETSKIIDSILNKEDNI